MLAVTPALSIPQPTDTKDNTCQDIKQESSALQADSLTEILAGTPEGLLLNDLKAARFRREKPCANTKTTLLAEYRAKKDVFYSKNNKSKAWLFCYVGNTH